MDLKLYRRVTVLFWALWWTTTFLTDFIGGLQQMQMINWQWAVNIKNYVSLVKTLAMYSIPSGWVAALYVGIVIWAFVAMFWYWWAFVVDIMQGKFAMKLINQAFFISIGLWMMFFLADQVTLRYVLEENHMVQAGFQLLSWVSLYVFSRKQIADVR